ncbi:10719_t:CDS:2 [Cetraspora pellucida]|uniref:10719_t:CDS:1 n=1 Tax=Cetraspora pellucida TaxID=1433469 RepID=A0A9N9HM60_9GLOM|nr:10719_t:CDS:2 [Cetraspora pellucida]
MAQSQLNLSFEGIPEDFNYFYLYFPKYKYKTLTLMSTKKRHIKNIKKNASPPRPPNKFFLFKNAFMLEFKYQYQKRFEKLSMPNLCKYTQEIWKNVPEEVKTTYAKLAVEAQTMHNELFPNYVYRPNKKKRVKKGACVNDQEDSSMSKNMSTFSSTTLLAEQLHSIEDPQTTISPVATPPITSSTTTSPIINSLTTPSDGSPLIPSLEGQTFFQPPEEFDFSLTGTQYTISPGQTFFQPPEEFGFHLTGTQFTLLPDVSTYMFYPEESIIPEGSLALEFPTNLDNINHITSDACNINYYFLELIRGHTAFITVYKSVRPFVIFARHNKHDDNEFSDYNSGNTIFVT